MIKLHTLSLYAEIARDKFAEYAKDEGLPPRLRSQFSKQFEEADQFILDAAEHDGVQWDDLF